MDNKSVEHYIRDMLSEGALKKIPVPKELVGANDNNPNPLGKPGNDNVKLPKAGLGSTIKGILRGGARAGIVGAGVAAVGAALDSVTGTTAASQDKVTDDLQKQIDQIKSRAAPAEIPSPTRPAVAAPPVVTPTTSPTTTPSAPPATGASPAVSAAAAAAIDAKKKPNAQAKTKPNAQSKIPPGRFPFVGGRSSSSFNHPSAPNVPVSTYLHRAKERLNFESTMVEDDDKEAMSKHHKRAQIKMKIIDENNSRKRAILNSVKRKKAQDQSIVDLHPKLKAPEAETNGSL